MKYRNDDTFLFENTRVALSAVCMYTNKRGVFLYHFSDFDTVNALPDVVSATDLSKAIGLSTVRTYQLMDELRIPYLKIAKRKIMFKEHLVQGLSGNRIFTDVAKLNAIVLLPEVFSPKRLQSALGISNGFAYSLVRTPGFPAVLDRDRIVVSKQGFIRWIRNNELYTGKED